MALGPYRPARRRARLRTCTPAQAGALSAAARAQGRQASTRGRASTSPPVSPPGAAGGERAWALRPHGSDARCFAPRHRSRRRLLRRVAARPRDHHWRSHRARARRVHRAHCCCATAVARRAGDSTAVREAPAPRGGVDVGGAPAANALLTRAQHCGTRGHRGGARGAVAAPSAECLPALRHGEMARAAAVAPPWRLPPHPRRPSVALRLGAGTLTMARLTVARLTVARLTVARLTVARRTVARRTVARRTVARLTVPRLTVARLTIWLDALL